MLGLLPDLGLGPSLLWEKLQSQGNILSKHGCHWPLLDLVTATGHEENITEKTGSSQSPNTSMVRL